MCDIYCFIFIYSPTRAGGAGGAVKLLLYLYFSNIYADGAECVYDGQGLFFIVLYCSDTYVDGAEG